MRFLAHSNRPIFVPLLLVLTAGSCSPPAPSEAKRIRILVEDLALSDRIATEPIGSTPSDSRIERARRSAERLEKLGRAAVPYLLEHVNDRRHGLCFESIKNPDVAQACLYILHRIVMEIPAGYRYAYDRPPRLFHGGNANAWWQQRQHKTLDEIRVEVLEWLIDQERKVPLVDEKGEASDLRLLERQLERLKSTPR